MPGAAENGAREPDHEQAYLRRLRGLLARRLWSDEELLSLPRLYRHACSVVARHEARGDDPQTAAQARQLVHRGHAFLYRERPLSTRKPFERALRLFFEDSPRTLRREWRLLLTTFVFVYGLAAVAWFAVSDDLDLAPSLLALEVVENEIEQLEGTAEGEPFVGNFDFGLGESPTAAGMIMLNNMAVGILFFASALVPPFYVYVLGSNALMLGTYTAVAGHWGQAGAISSILWCHGMIEIQAFLLAGTAGLCLVRAWVRPGPWSRRHALLRESRTALLLLAPVFPLLFVAGLIEGFVSPHAPHAVRLTVAIGTGILLLLWALLGGRHPLRTAS